MQIVVLHARQVQFIHEDERVLNVDVVVRGAVDDEESHGLLESGHVGYGGVVVAVGVVGWGVHVAFGVDRVYLLLVLV